MGQWGEKGGGGSEFAILRRSGGFEVGGFELSPGYLGLLVVVFCSRSCSTAHEDTKCCNVRTMNVGE